MEKGQLVALDPLLTPIEKDLIYTDSEFIDRFYKLITQSVKPPFAISLDGLWGTGKTAIMTLLERKLQKEGYPTFWFNPWEYRQTESVVLAFLQNLAGRHHDKLKEMRKTGGNVLQILLRSGIGAALKIYSKGNLSLEGVEEGLKRGELSYNMFQDSIETIKNEFTELIDGICKKHFQLIDKSLEMIQAEEVFSTNALARLRELKTLEYKNQTEFIEVLKEKIGEELSEQKISIILEHTKVYEKPVVVFFDDLDRCLPEDAIQLLEALKNLFVTPHCQVIFLCGIDTRVAKQFIKTHYNDLDESFAINYFRKIFNLTTSMPYSPDIYTLLIEYIEKLYGWDRSKAKKLAMMIYNCGVQAEISSVRKYLNIVHNFYAFHILNPTYEFSPDDDFVVHLLVMKEAWQPLYEEIVRKALKDRLQDIGTLISGIIEYNQSERFLSQEQEIFFNKYFADQDSPFFTLNLSEWLIKYPSLA